MNQDDIEDLAQDTFVTLWREQGRVLEGKAKGFLFGVAWRVFLAYRRKSLSRVRHRLNRHVTGLECEPTPLEAAANHERRAFLENAIGALPKAQATVIRLVYIEGHSSAEVAEMLGMARTTVYTHVARACRCLKETLRDDLWDHGVMAEFFVAPKDGIAERRPNASRR